MRLEELKKTWAIPAAVAAFIAFAAASVYAAGPATDPDADFDRLDGKGESGKRVDVIEWGDNLEIHVYPHGSIAGLALKIDDETNKDKKVMVIGYRFKESPKKQLIRRAILGIPLQKNFKVYRDPSESEFDKIVISNNTLSSDMAAFKTDPDPTQLFPDGHPALAKKEEPKGKRVPAATASSSKKSVPFTPAARNEAEPEALAKPVERKESPQLDENGTIKPFFSE